MLLALPCDIEDRYTIVSELGHGSHAIVYRAIDRSLDREVAIKVLRSELVDSDVSDRFRREIRLTSQLEHPNIAHVYGTGEFMGAPYFVTAIARGASLAERLQRERQLPVDEALAITKEIASALGHAHRAGIIHRDVKPANILLTPDGALLTDFGVARALELSPGTLATSTGVAVGTLLYMSPEQLCAEKGIDARSDQYALALVLYEMLAGVSAHVAANAEGLRTLRIVGQHTPVRMLRTSVPENVDAALSRALSPTPADRFGTMGEFVRRMEGAKSTDSALRTTGAGSRVRRMRAWLPRRMIAGAAMFAILTGGGLGASNWLKAREQREPASGAPATSYTVIASGDSQRDAAFARALAAELSAWPDISAEVSTVGASAASTHIRARLSSVAGGLSARVAVGDGTGASAHVREVNAQFPAATEFDTDSLKLVAARILLATAISPDSIANVYAVSTRSTKAIHAYAAGWRALLAGELDSSATAFGEASRENGVPQAALWRAIAQSWRHPKDEGSWRVAARAAFERSHELNAGDSLLATGLWLRSAGRITDACAAFAEATAIARGYFAAWYGLATCMQRDSIVIPDRVSPTGLRFRSSYWAANHAYEEAIARLPSPQLVQLFDDAARTTLALNGRRGWAATASGPLEAVAGLPTLIGDSVTVFPRATRLLVSGSRQNVPISYARAVVKGRERLVSLTKALALRAPASVSAQIAFAHALEYAGYLSSESRGASALTVLSGAARLAQQRHDRVEIGATEIRVRLRLADFPGAGRVATSLLNSPIVDVSADDAEQLAAIAVLVGRSALAESLLVIATTLSPARTDGLPLPIARVAAAYSAAAATGECQMLSRLRALLREYLREHYAPAELTAVSERWIAPGDWMGLTCYGAPIPAGASREEPLISAFEALKLRNGPRVIQAVRAMQKGREGAAASSVSWDTRHAELWLLASAGDSADAREQLRAARRDLGATMDYVLIDVVRAAGFRRSLMLCTELARKGGNVESDDRWCGDALHALSTGRS